LALGWASHSRQRLSAYEPWGHRGGTRALISAVRSKSAHDPWIAPRRSAVRIRQAPPRERPARRLFDRLPHRARARLSNLRQVVADGAAKSSRGCSTGAQAATKRPLGMLAPLTPEKHRKPSAPHDSYDPKCGSLARYQSQNRRDLHKSPFGRTRVVTWGVGTSTGKAPGRFRCACDRRTLGTSRTRRPPAGGSEAARGPVCRSP